MSTSVTYDFFDVSVTYDGTNTMKDDHMGATKIERNIWSATYKCGQCSFHSTLGVHVYQ